MPTREEMHSLAQEITGSYEARTAGVAQIRRATQAQLRESHSAHQAMSRQQRADLSKGRADLRTSVSAQFQGLDRGHSSLRQAETRRKSEVNTWLREVTTEHAGAREEWQKMATTMQAKRAGATAVAEAPAPATVPAQKAPAKEARKRSSVMAT